MSRQAEHLSLRISQLKIIIDLLTELQRQEVDLERIHMEQLSASSLEEHWGQLELKKAQIIYFHGQRSGILLSLQQEVANFVARKRLAARDSLLQVDQIADLRRQVVQINQELDRMYEVNQCCICLMYCDAGGGHCLVSLRCGHLFGRNCIHRALRNSNQCPVCRRGALESHVRRIYGLAFFPF
ncbi:uncharacterized protein LOC123037349 [Drosophila rhopaloa]|uniref:RING-type domain-containing protein n=1 Tax=Drosophila rhopaloa TaxID=1041015 RepID=A0ABM5J3M5_DRORH|nr:uncharacterized protein LOC123037349 [Drosophila rhopaloa]